MSTNSTLQGSVAIVKSVLSADTLCLRGKPVNGPPPEKLFSLANVMAPRLNLKEPEKEEVLL
jgi:staphylococcal nuclease domain-containing protein 1